MRSWAGVVVLVCLSLGACSRQEQGRTAGSQLPVTASGSAALPGATDAADAPHAPAVAESHDATLTSYRDPETGVSFQYPTVWRPPAGAVSLPVPALTGVAGAPRMSQQFLPQGTPYASTVLLGLRFSYTEKGGSDQESCARLPAAATAGGGATSKVTYGTVQFTEATGSDAAMCTHLETKIDSALHGSRCLLFERDFVTSCPYVKTDKTPRPLTMQETTALQRHLDAVMGSVQLTPR